MAMLRSSCPISYSLDLFGDKWTLLILRDMLMFRKKNFGEFLRSQEKIATNILADRLERLVEHGLAVKSGDDENKRLVNYVPTEKALALRPVLDAMYTWGSAHKPATRAPQRGRTRSRNL